MAAWNWRWMKVGVAAAVLLGALTAGCAMHRGVTMPEIKNYLPVNAKGDATGEGTGPQVGEGAAEGLESGVDGNAVAQTGTAADRDKGARQVQPEQDAVPPEGIVKEPLSLEECFRIALDRNPLERAAKAGITIAREEVGVSRAPYYPAFDLESGYSRWQKHAFLPEGLLEMRQEIPSIIGPTDDWSAGLNARYLLFDSGRRQADLRVALSRENVAEEEASRVRQDLLLNVARGFYTLAAAVAERKVQVETLERAEDYLRLARERFAVGDVPHADVLRAQVEVADSRLGLVRAESAVRIARGRLNSAMGLPVELPVDVDTELGEITPPGAVSVNEALERAVHLRPELKSSLGRISAARYGVERAKSLFGPSFSARAGYGWRDTEFAPEDEEWLLGVTLELPIFTGFSRRHGLAAAKAGLVQEEAGAESLVLQVREEVWTACSRLQEAYEAIQAARVQVENATESLRLIRERYQVGAATITDLLDAQTALTRASTAQVEAQWQYRTADVELQRAMGALDPGLAFVTRY